MVAMMLTLFFAACTDGGGEDLFPVFSYRLDGNIIEADPYAGSVVLSAEPVRINLDVGDDRLYIELDSYRRVGGYEDFFIRYINTVPYYSGSQRLLEFSTEEPTYVEGRFEGVLLSPDGSSSVAITDGFFRLRKD